MLAYVCQRMSMYHTRYSIFTQELHLYPIYSIVTRLIGLAAKSKVRSQANLSCIQVLYTRYPIVMRALGLAAARPSARASKGILHTNTSVAYNTNWDMLLTKNGTKY